MPSRKICVVTGSRADYGLLRRVMAGIRQAPGLELQIIVTGMHLSRQFGFTWRAIEQDGFVIDGKVDIALDSDRPAGICRSMGQGLTGIGEYLQSLRPDVILVLGDRFEIFSAVVAALVARIPVAHLHGGEASAGAIDESFRHAITKMSHLHFVAAEAYRDRVIQLGEDPEHVFLVGAPGLDNISELDLLDRPALEEALGIQLAARNLLITFHPVTLEQDQEDARMTELLAALGARQDTRLIFTLPNADTNHRVLFDRVHEFVRRHDNACLYTSLGQLRYLSCLSHVDGVIGNSSSGLIEAPSFHVGTVNIGDRQQGRLKAASVIDCSPDRAAITAAIDRLYTPEFRQLLQQVENPYGRGGASEKIVDILSRVSLDGIIKKHFFDLQTV